MQYQERKIANTFDKMVSTLEQIKSMLGSRSLRILIEEFGGDASALENARDTINTAINAIEEADYFARANVSEESLENVQRLAGIQLNK